MKIKKILILSLELINKQKKKNKKLRKNLKKNIFLNSNKK